MHELLTILYEDNHCLAVDKPAPLVIQHVGTPTDEVDFSSSLEGLVKHYLKVCCHKSGAVYLGMPHRLDRPTTGVVLFARTTKSAQRLAEQFQRRQVYKSYWALVEGQVEPESARLEDWLRKVPGAARTELADPEAPGAQRAVLRYRRLAVSRAESLMEVELETGRMHQIRAQLAARGWPIRGDTLYGARAPFGVPDANRIALHARRLVFLHPIRYELISVTAPLPDYWREVEWLAEQ